jgi:hypothetical protein
MAMFFVFCHEEHCDVFSALGTSIAAREYVRVALNCMMKATTDFPIGIRFHCRCHGTSFLFYDAWFVVLKK